MGKKDCKFCDKEGLLILPLRYAAIVGEAKALADIPALPTTLGAGVKDIALTHGKYAPRMVREGYIYVLIDREGIKYWEAYLVIEDAFLYKFDPKEPPSAQVDFSCDRSVCGIDASCIAIDKVDKVNKAYLLFTPSPMTEAKLKEYKDNADTFAAKGKMQAFDPKAWAKSGSKAQEHSLKPELIGQHVAEWILYKQCDKALTSEFGKAMAQQLYMPSSSSFAGVPPIAPNPYQPGRLGVLEGKLVEKKAAAFVIYDDIGITQECNIYRNAALTPVEIFLNKRDKTGINNQRKLEVAQAIEDIHKSFVKNAIDIAKERMDGLNSDYRLPDIDVQNAKTLRSQGRVREAEVIEKRIERRRQLDQTKLSGAYAESQWLNKYVKLLDTDELKKFNDELASLSDKCGKLADERADQHMAWLMSDKLVDAFDTYDQNNLGSGFAFTHQHMRCTFGMFGVDKNKPTLAKWVNVKKIERKNLYMRSNFYNQHTVMDEASKTFAEVQQGVTGAESVSHFWPAVAKISKNLVDVLKKTDSAWDEWLRDKVVKSIHTGKTKPQPGNPIHNLCKFHRSAEGLMFSRISEWAQALSNKSGKMDKGIQVIVGTLLYSKLGDLTYKVAIDELMLKLRPERLEEGYKKRSAQRNQELAERDVKNKAAVATAKNLDDPIETLLRDERTKVKNKVTLTLDEIDKGARPETNNFRQARMGVLLMAIEGFALTLKLNDDKELTARGKAEVAASVLSLSGMAVDMVYAVAKSMREIEPYKDALGFDAATDIARGGLKMTAGALSAGAGAITAVLDGISFADEFSKDKTNWVLASVYFSKVVVGGIGLGLGLIAAFSYGAPFLWRIAGSTVMNNSVFAMRLTMFFATSAVSAEAVAVARTLWLIRVARFNMAGLVITIGEIGYRSFIMDNELEDWLKACTFRKEKREGLLNSKPYPDTKKELEELQKAYKTIAVH